MAQGQPYSWQVGCHREVLYPTAQRDIKELIDQGLARFAMKARVRIRAYSIAAQ